MKILKASAGSGKTFNLAKEYIRLLISSDSPEAYRHVLAVTFTNKATDEMKRRILKELYVLSREPEKSPYYSALVPAVVATRQELKRKSYRMLVGILHDYSSFAVSTIDKFFQQTLRAFSREIGQFTSYQVELDKDALVDETVDRVLESLSTRNSPLLDWIVKGVRNDLMTTGRFTLDRRLKELAASIVSENPRDTEYSRESMDELRSACGQIIERFVEDVRSGAAAVLDSLQGTGVTPEDTNRGFLKSVSVYLGANTREPVFPPTPSFMEKAQDPEKWFSRAKAQLRFSCEPTLGPALDAFCHLFEGRFREYSTAMTIRSQIFGLGIASELRQAFISVQRDRGVISIDDTNTILHDIIDGTDTPFLYEKLGVRFDDFLLDEFQDTSGIQWDNFQPLLANSDAAGHDNLVVGDVKQSIYRWRGSQWDLLDSRLQRQFHVPPSDITVLDGNYRTCKAIVEFNNAFFPYAAGVIDDLVGNSPAAADSLRSIYSDVVQEIRTKDPAPGSVEVSFVENSAAELDAIADSIEAVLSRGGKYSDIAVLVRGNAEGSAIAEYLVGKDIPVVSDDSLFVKSSVTVRRLVSQLSIVDNPARAEGTSVAGYLAREMHLAIPEHYHCLSDLAESLLAGIRDASPELFASEVPFVQAFMDYLEDWCHKNGQSLSAFLHDWEEADPKIASPESGDAVRIMTVHKSKGLEFPFVIFPFVEKVGLYKPTAYWCKPDVQGTALEAVATGRFRASLSDSSLNSLFRDDYLRERTQQAVDNLNVMYVAMTRAKNGLKVIASIPPKSFTGGADAKNLSQILFSYVGGQNDYLSGEPYDFSSVNRTGDSTATIELRYECSPNDAQRRLCFRTSDPAVFDDEPVHAAPQTSEPSTDTAPSPAPVSEVVLEPTLF